MALDNYQMEYDSLVFGTDQVVGIQSVVGLQDFDVNLGDVPIPRGDGDVPGLINVRGREIQVQLLIEAERNSEALRTAVSEVEATFQPQSGVLPLKYKLPHSEERFVYARVIGRVFAHDVSTTHGLRPILIRFKLADPRTYSVDEVSANVGIYDASGGGMNYADFVAETAYGKEYTVDTSTEVVVSNSGDANAYPLIRFYGPTSGTLTAVKLTNTTTGQEFEVVTSVLSGQILESDQRRIVAADSGDTPFVHIGGATRYANWVLPRAPFYLAPGDNLLRYEITGTASDAPCILNYNDTWL